MDGRLKLIDRLKILLSGHLYVGDEIKEGWKEPLPFYVFICPKHGLVKNYAKGYDKRLECPLCAEEEKEREETYPRESSRNI